MKFLFLFLISFSVMANYLPESKIDGSSTDGMTIFSSQSDCQSYYSEPCIRIPVGYKKEYHRVIVTKSQAENCSDDSDCQSKLALKSCADAQEMAIKVLDSDPKEVYCTKKHVSHNSGLKASYDTTKGQSDALEAGIQVALKSQACGARVKALLLVRNAPKNLTKQQKKQLVQTYKDTITLLDAGSLDAAKDDIVEATADGTIVTESDKTALAAQIDACKP